MDNTSIVALTLPNNNRHVYFQEKTGAFRRAIYSSQAKLWRTVLDPQLPPDSNDETPLAGVTGLNIFQGERGYFFSDPYEGDDNVSHHCNLLHL